MTKHWSRAWHAVRIGLFFLATAWAGDAFLTQLAGDGTGVRPLVIPALALLGFVSLSLHELRAFRRSQPGGGASATGPGHRSPG